jgi:hypothetical protein
MDQNWDKKNINQVQEKLNETHLLCPPSPNTSCPSSPGSQRQFVGKLVEILNDMSNSNLISWNQSGTSFIVKDTETFSQVILPKYFKTNNFNSFVRQLNMYNFHKVKNANSKGTKGEDPVWEFENENFIRDKPHLLVNIKRKANEKDNGIQAQFYDLQNKYNELFIYVKNLQEDLIRVKEDNCILNNMIENLKNYTDEKFKYYVRAPPNNNLLNVPENKYSGGITSPHLNENHITTSSPFIVGSNDNMQGVTINSPNNITPNNISPSINGMNNMNNMNNMNSPLTSVMQTTGDDNYNRINSGNLSPININTNHVNHGNVSPNNGGSGDYRYLNLGNSEFRCLSPNNSDISEGVRSNQSGIGYLENLPE